MGYTFEFLILNLKFYNCFRSVFLDLYGELKFPRQKKV